jgi:hypothetical protein
VEERERDLYYHPDVDCRAAIYASPDLGLTFHKNLSSRDCAICSIIVAGQKVYFSSVYLDITLPVEETAFVRTIRKASSAQRHFLGGINTNAHSDVWGPPPPTRAKR